MRPFWVFFFSKRKAAFFRHAEAFFPSTGKFCLACKEQNKTEKKKHSASRLSNGPDHPNDGFIKVKKNHVRACVLTQLEMWANREEREREIASKERFECFSCKKNHTKINNEKGRKKTSPLNIL